LLALLNILSVALGVAVYLATQIANHSANRAFAATVDMVAGKAELQITAPSGNLPETVFPMVKNAMWNVLKALRPDVDVHGFRSTFSGWASNRYLGGIDDKKAVIEVVLKHRVHANETEKAYSQHVRYSEERARLMQLWAQYATGTEVHTVVHLRAS
jgi:integrase